MNIILWIVLFFISIIFADKLSKILSRLFRPLKFRGKGYAQVLVFQNLDKKFSRLLDLIFKAITKR